MGAPMSGRDPGREPGREPEGPSHPRFAAAAMMVGIVVLLLVLSLASAR